MSREIKFKVWDKERERMSEPFDFYSGIVSFPGDSLPLMFVTGKSISRDRFIWLQYAEKNDKNGTEIYDGDILRGYRKVVNHAKSEPKYAEMIFEVRYNIGRAAFEIYYPRMKWTVFLGHCQDGPYEVIGNIYQNKNLLK